MEYDYSGLILEDLTREAAEMGFEGVEVRFSLGYCQGDGVSFTGDVSAKKALGIAEKYYKGRQLAAIRKAYHDNDHIPMIIKGDSTNYVHWNTTTVSCEMYYLTVSDFEESCLFGLIDCIQEEVQEAGKVLEKYGYQVLEAYQRGDAVIDDDDDDDDDDIDVDAEEGVLLCA